VIQLKQQKQQTTPTASKTGVRVCHCTNALCSLVGVWLLGITQNEGEASILSCRDDKSRCLTWDAALTLHFLPRPPVLPAVRGSGTDFDGGGDGRRIFAPIKA
jgi:hypothetical protein